MYIEKHPSGWANLANLPKVGFQRSSGSWAWYCALWKSVSGHMLRFSRSCIYPPGTFWPSVLWLLRWWTLISNVDGSLPSVRSVSLVKARTYEMKARRNFPLLQQFCMWKRSDKYSEQVSTSKASLDPRYVSHDFSNLQWAVYEHFANPVETTATAFTYQNPGLEEN